MKQLDYIDSGQQGPSVLVLAGVHGDEPEPMYVVWNLAAVLSKHLKKGKVYLVSVANESAYQTGTRQGADGIDLARICPGSLDGMPTEQEAHEVSNLIGTVDFLIDMHTGGMAYDIFPMVGYLLHPDGNILKQQQDLALSTGLPLVWGTDYRPNGRTLSVARDNNIPAIYFEYGGGTGFRKQVATSYLKAVLRVLGQLGMAECGSLNTKDLTINGYQYWLEDHRMDSGHLQAKTPAPIDGVFVADVAVGDYVQSNERIGEIFNPLTGERFEVRSSITGLVHFLRVVVKVGVGDSLGGVLPVKKGKKEVIHA